MQAKSARFPGAATFCFILADCSNSSLDRVSSWRTVIHATSASIGGGTMAFAETERLMGPNFIRQVCALHINA
jgi:hypothetical protein